MFQDENKIEEIILICSTQLPSCSQLLNNNNFKYVIQSLPMKILLVDDEHTKNLLLSVNITILPLLLLKIGEDVLEVKKASYILKVLEDLDEKKKKHQEIPVQQDIVPIQKQLFKPQVIYKNDDYTISFIGCDKFMTMDDSFDLTVVSENCRKVHFENENYVAVNVTNVNSLKKLVPLLTTKKNILTVSKTKRLCDLVSAMCMFYIHHSSLEEIQNTTAIPKKTLVDLFSITDEIY